MWKPRKILAGTDFSETSTGALAVAANLAWRLGAELHLAHSYDGRSRWVTGYALLDDLLVDSAPVAEQQRRVREELAALARGMRTHDLEPVLHPLLGDPAAELATLREKIGAELVVLGARGLRGVRRFLLGSVADRTLRRPGAPLLLVDQAPAGGEFKRILLCLEAPGEARPWTRAAVSLAHALRAELELLHVLPPPGYVSDRHRVELHSERAATLLERQMGDLEPSVPLHVVTPRGDPVDLIPSVARESGCDLVVVGAERHLDGWPGRVTDRVARAGLPALLVVWREASA